MAFWNRKEPQLSGQSVNTVSSLVEKALANFQNALDNLSTTQERIEQIRDKDESELAVIQARVIESEQALDRIERVRSRISELIL